MKLPSFRRIIKEDFDTAVQDMVDKLALSINSAVDSIYYILNRGITLQDNVKCTVKDVTVSVNSDGTPKNTLGFKLDISGTILGMNVLNVTNLTNTNRFPTSGVMLSFTQSGDAVTITHITGLESGYSYRLKVVAFGQ